jgi:hypothetical protein
MIHIFGIYTEDWEPLVDLVLPLWAEYAERHGHAGHFGCFKPRFPEHYSFTKSAVIAEELAKLPEHDSMFVIDLDMIPTNMTYDLGRTVVKSKYPSCGVAMGKDINGWNSGAYFIDNQPWALAWLKCIIELRKDLTSEQHAMWRINEAFGVVEAETINSIPYHVYEGFNHERKDHYSQWKAGDFTLHLPGMTNAERIPILEDYSKLIIR